MLCLHFAILSGKSARFALAFLQLLVAQLFLLSTLSLSASCQAANSDDSVVDSSRFASITLSRAASTDPGNSMRVHERRLEALNVSALDLIAFAWNITPMQVQGSLTWVRDERFNLAGDAGGNSQLTVERWRAMVRDALRKRFALEAPSREEAARWLRSHGGTGRRADEGEFN